MKPSDFVKKGWCQHMSARDSHRKPVHVTDPEAAAWCMAGAVSAAYWEDVKRRGSIYDKLRAALGGESVSAIPQWNDAICRTQAEVVALLEQIGE